METCILIFMGKPECCREVMDADNSAADTREVGYRHHRDAQQEESERSLNDLPSTTDDVRAGKCIMLSRRCGIEGIVAHSAESVETRFRFCVFGRVFADRGLKIVIAVIEKELACKMTCFNGFVIAMIVTLAKGTFMKEMLKLSFISNFKMLKFGPAEDPNDARITDDNGEAG